MKTCSHYVTAEHACSHPSVHIPGDRVSVDICARCRFYTTDPTAPKMRGKLSQFAKALTRWIAAGRPVRTDEQVAELFAICETCEHFTGKECRKCGCPVGRDKRWRNKLRWATEACPVGKWQADVTEEAPSA